MKILTKLTLSVAVMLACLISVYLLQQQQSSPLVYRHSSEVYFIYPIPNAPVYKGSITTSPATPSVPSESMLSPLNEGKSSATPSSLSLYKGTGAVEPFINFKSSKSVVQSAGQVNSGFVYGSASTKGGGTSASYGLASSLSKPNGTVGLMYYDTDPIAPDNLQKETAGPTLPVGNGVWILLMLVAIYWEMKRR